MKKIVSLSLNSFICIGWKHWKRWKRSKKAWKSQTMKNRRVWLTRTRSLQAIDPKQQNRNRPRRLRFKWINRASHKSLSFHMNPNRSETHIPFNFLYEIQLQIGETAAKPNWFIDSLKWENKNITFFFCSCYNFIYKYFFFLN